MKYKARFLTPFHSRQLRQFSGELTEFVVFFHVNGCFDMNHLFLFAVGDEDSFEYHIFNPLIN